MNTAAMPTDEDIAREVQNGDAERFGLLVQRYEERITRYGRKFLLGSDIQDVVQEVFLKAFINIRSFDLSRKFSSWLYRIAHNEFINAIKKRSRLPLFSFDLDTLFPHLAASETAHGEVEKRETRRMLEGALATLDPKYREPLVLYYLEDLEYSEIAEIMRIPISTVGVRLARGKALLKKAIKHHE